MTKKSGATPMSDAPIVERQAPQWTVVYNIVSPESKKWVGTGWEFFDTEAQAAMCYARQIILGNTVTKRRFHSDDWPHLGAAHHVVGWLKPAIPA